ncbi:DUF1724 domain-containing protein [Candidatus Bathyarchaeota archaeon]|nr:DUF1724 domain-containing protein [Candidatus Bathyarchaeota archaeon]NIW34688.1 DUF1724 domain-containing protein [Candidatus Bathyarchaeota archaeon]
MAFTVSDHFLSLGLFSIDGNYDVYNDLISTDESAIRWGRELYGYFKKDCKKIESPP